MPELREVEPLKPLEPPLRPSEEFLAQLRQEIPEARGGVPPSDDEPFIGELTRGEFYRLPEEEQEAIWDEVWAQAEAEAEKATEAHYRERPVKPDALIAGQKRYSYPKPF